MGEPDTTQRESIAPNLAGGNRTALGGILALTPEMLPMVGAGETGAVFDAVVSTELHAPWSPTMAASIESFNRPIRLLICSPCMQISTWVSILVG